jgi:hypothetical protein
MRSLALIITASLMAGSLRAQIPTFGRLWPGNYVEILELQRNTWRRVYQSPAWSTTALSVSPDGGRIALLAWAEGKVVSELVVIDTAGRVLAPGVPQVQRYDWCGATCIVYLTGLYDESHYGFRYGAVGMLDIGSGETRSLPSPTTPIGILWLDFDSSAYVKNLPRRGEAYIYRLDLAHRKLEPTRLHDHVFSPTGRYYLYEGEFTDTLVVYDTRTNTPVDIETFRRGSIPLGWVSAREDLLLAVKRPPPRRGPLGRPRPRDPKEVQPYVLYRVYDLPRRVVRDSVVGHLKDWAGSGNLRLVERDGKYHVVGAP